MINNDTRNIIDSSIGSCLPDSVVKNALQGFDPGKGRVILISIGKAAWTMANAAVGFIGDIQYADRESNASRDYRGGLRKLEQLLKIFRNEKVDFCIGMGDLGDGIHKDEIPLVLDVYRKSGLEIRHVAGNHDLVLNTEEEVKKLLGLPAMYFDYTVKNIRFVVIDSLDVSRFSPPGTDTQRRRGN